MLARLLFIIAKKKPPIIVMSGSYFLGI